MESRPSQSKSEPSDDRADVAPDATLAEVFRHHYRPLLRLAYVLTESQHEAEELVQDAFVDLQANWHRVLNPPGYLRTVVANGARRRGRRSTNRRRIFERHHAASQREHLRQPAFENYLTDVLSRLPARYRIALVLAYFGDLSSNEIAEAMNCRPGTARSLVHRGLRMLRKELAHE